MAHTKSGGSTKNTRDSKPKYLGIKLYAGQIARPGSIIVRQRGNKYFPGENVGQGKDHTIYSLIKGKVKFLQKRRTKFNGQTRKITEINIVA